MSEKQLFSNDDDAEGEGDPHFEPRLIQEENAVTEALGRVGERECKAKATFVIDAILDRVGSDDVVEMSVSFTLGDRDKAESIEFSRWPEKKEEEEPEKKKEPTADVAEHSRFKAPLVLAYGAGRHMGIGNLDFDAAPGPTQSLFSGSIELFDADELLRYLDYASSGRGSAKALRQKEVLLGTIAALLPGVGTTEKIKIYRPSAIGVAGKSGVYVQTGDGEVG